MLIAGCPEGVERHVAVNHLAGFALTALLLDLLRAGAPSRVVFGRVARGEITEQLITLHNRSSEPLAYDGVSLLDNESGAFLVVSEPTLPGQVLAPGLIDMRAFIGEPGGPYRETLKSAGEAAAAGGVTTVVSMPDTSPALDDPAVIDFIVRRARDTSIVNVRPAAALTKGLEGREMAEIGRLREAGAIAFTDGARSVTNAQVMRRALTYAGDFDALIIHHVEDPDLVGQGVMNEGEFAARLGLPGIPHEAETVMLERDIRLVRLTGGRGS